MSIKKSIKNFLKGTKKLIFDDNAQAYPEVPFDNSDAWMQFAYVKLMQNDICARRPQYVWGVLQGAAFSKVLGFERISVIEVGVAGGGGLISMEKSAELAEKMIGIKIDVYGFDTGTGMPMPDVLDYRDVPYRWSIGNWPLDKEKLESQLSRSKLILGNTKDTIPQFVHSNPAPIAFVAYDLLMYSSTLEALKLFDADYKLLLPRTYCMFRSYLGTRGDICDFVAERLAIKEFNMKYEMRKVCHMDGLRYFIPYNQDSWPDWFNCLHIFDHPLYCKPCSYEQSVDIDMNCKEHLKEIS